MTDTVYQRHPGYILHIPYFIPSCFIPRQQKRSEDPIDVNIVAVSVALHAQVGEGWPTFRFCLNSNV